MKTDHAFNTSSIAFPNMFEVARPRVATYVDSKSIVNRTRLLLLSNPTEMYNDPPFGIGLKRYLFQYNNDNTKALIQDNIKAKLKIYEPKVKAEETSFADGLLFTGNDVDPTQEYNHLKMTVGLVSIYGDKVSLSVDSEEFEYSYDPETKDVKLNRIETNRPIDNY